ncbi:MAG: thiamine-phosphate kinase [Oceanicaulis sp.]
MAGQGGEGEFAYIARRLAPLTEGLPGAARLKDDAAVLAVPAGRELVVTTDTLIEGRHFPEEEDSALAARKALRANLSDLAAMAADPWCYFLNIVWPIGGFEARKDGFADGLAEDQNRYGVTLAGGDTTAADGPWTIAVTMLGTVPAGRAVRRGGASAGDILAVTGTIGDAWLGLEHRLGRIDFDVAAAAHVSRRFTLPEPRIALAEAVRAYANAAIDVSDGLIADAGHVADASGLRAEIDLGRLPLSHAARGWLDRQDDRVEALLSLAGGGDDYELVLAVPEARFDGLKAMIGDVGLTAIGRLTDGAAGATVTCDGRTIEARRSGFTHF